MQLPKPLSMPAAEISSLQFMLYHPFFGQPALKQRNPWLVPYSLSLDAYILPNIAWILASQAFSEASLCILSALSKVRTPASAILQQSTSLSLNFLTPF